jgi:hypothetical protein
MESTEFRLEQLEHTLDAVGGAQTAMFAALGYLLSTHRGNPQAIAVIGNALEAARVGMMNSATASDYKAQAFDEMAETVLELLS